MREAITCAEKKRPGGKLVKICLKLRNSEVNGVILTGDFFVEPEEVFEEVLKKLLELSCKLGEVSSSVLKLLESSNIKIYGLTIEDVKEALERAIRQVEGVSGSSALT